ncbi:MAG: hypothetical protein H6679_02305 [Epsilonproteobacteria bacterium]|nr:hypothetical protein [Campylobacterota bacterium]
MRRIHQFDNFKAANCFCMCNITCLAQRYALLDQGIVSGSRKMENHYPDAEINSARHDGGAQAVL